MNSHLSYEQQEGIHIFVWYSANRRAVDSWLGWMSKLVERDGQLGSIIIDFSGIPLPPISYMARAVRAWMQQYPTVPYTQIAVIYAETEVAFLILGRSYAMTLSRGRDVSLKFFQDSDADQVWQWLNAGSAASS
ncbi:MAG: hypothetical protein AAFR67_17665 [Chloroflexota bacterium]